MAEPWQPDTHPLPTLFDNSYLYNPSDPFSPEGRVWNRPLPAGSPFGPSAPAPTRVTGGYGAGSPFLSGGAPNTNYGSPWLGTQNMPSSIMATQLATQTYKGPPPQSPFAQKAGGAGAGAPVDPLAKYKGWASKAGVDWNVLNKIYLPQHGGDYYNAIDHAVSDGIWAKVAQQFQIELNDQTWNEYAQAVGNRSVIDMPLSELRARLENSPLRGHNYAIDNFIDRVIAEREKENQAPAAQAAAPVVEPAPVAQPQPEPVVAQAQPTGSPFKRVWAE